MNFQSLYNIVKLDVRSLICYTLPSNWRTKCVLNETWFKHMVQAGSAAGTQRCSSITSLANYYNYSDAIYI